MNNTNPSLPYRTPSGFFFKIFGTDSISIDCQFIWKLGISKRLICLDSRLLTINSQLLRERIGHATIQTTKYSARCIEITCGRARMIGSPKSIQFTHCATAAKCYITLKILIDIVGINFISINLIDVCIDICVMMSSDLYGTCRART